MKWKASQYIYDISAENMFSKYTQLLSVLIPGE